MAKNLEISLLFDFYGDMQNVKLQVPVTQEYLRDKNFLPTGETAYGSPRDLALANGEFVPAKQPFSAFYKANDKTVALFKGAGASVYYEAESIFGYRMLYRGDGDSFAVVYPLKNKRPPKRSQMPIIS